jgi:hypothetical protein
VHRDLTHDVRGAAEPVQTKSLRITAKSQRPVTDQPGAEQRRSLQVRVVRRDREAKTLVGNGELRVPAVDVVPGEARALAQVLAFGVAVTTHAAGPTQPRNPDAVADAKTVAGPRRNDLANDLMSRNERQAWFLQITVDDMEIGSADAACSDPNQNLIRARFGFRKRLFAQRLTLSAKHHGAHVTIIAPIGDFRK